MIKAAISFCVYVFLLVFLSIPYPKRLVLADKEKALDEILNRKRQIAAHTKYISLPNKGDSMNLRLFAELPTPKVEADGNSKFDKKNKFSWTVVDLDLLGKNGDIENIPKQKFEVGISTHKLWSKATEGDCRCFKIVREGEGLDTRYRPYPLDETSPFLYFFM